MNKLLLFFCLLASTSVFSDLKSDLDNQINPLMDKVIEWRHDIYRNPELRTREYRIAKKIEAHLRSLGIKVETKIAYTGAEDFSFFSNVIPGMYFWLGVNAPGVMEAPGNHSPYFVVDDGALDEGLKALVYLVEDYPKE